MAASMTALRVAQSSSLVRFSSTDASFSSACGGSCSIITLSKDSNACSTSSMLLLSIFLFYGGQILDSLLRFLKRGTAAQADVAKCLTLCELKRLPLH